MRRNPEDLQLGANHSDGHVAT